VSNAVVAVKLTRDSSSVRLAVDTSNTFPAPSYSSSVSTTDRVAKMSISGLAADTVFFCAVEVDGELLLDTIGTFRTKPSSGTASFKCAFAGDAGTGSTSIVFDEIRAQAPLFFIHLGDMHYENISVNDVATFEAAYDAVLAAAPQAQLYREVATVYVWDDHDFGPNDSYSGSPGRDAACEAYRKRVPHLPLVESGTTDAIYHSFTVGRVMFVITDLRSESSNKSATDDSSKTMMGATQKTWFKALFSNPANDGMLFVWICSRVWGGAAAAGADHWGGFTTERTELANHFQTEAPGRVCVISADMHSLAIDDGTNHDFVTTGSNPLPTFQAAALDRTGNTTYGGGTYSEGRFVTNNNFGVMEITDAGGATITVDWTGYDLDGNVLVTYQFSPTLGVP
jgi:phosphodiesterase/alkaline phosphatase D-like protein